MSYLAIARKWRPQRFEDLVGQGHVSRTLQNALRTGRIHHAYLLTGARGVGKTSAARILAKALQCERGPADNPCNECGACRQVSLGSHPDVAEIDGASNNRVEDIRDLIEKVRYMPAQGRYRIYVIDEVHMVTPQAFNALLKTLEEPPAHVVFIFATTDPQKILDTVLSRCQRFDFKMIPVRVIHDRLREICRAEAVSITDGALMLVAREAGGSMRDAQSLLDQVLAAADGPLAEPQVVETLGFIDRSLLQDLLEALVGGDAAAALLLLRRVHEFGYDPLHFAREVLEGLRHVMVLSLVRDAERLVDLPDDERDRLLALSRTTTPEATQRRFDLLSQSLDEIARADSPMLSLEMALVRVARVRPYVPLEGLVDRLLGLERRLQAGGGASVPGGALADAAQVAPPRGAAPSPSRTPAASPGTQAPAPTAVPAAGEPRVAATDGAADAPAVAPPAAPQAGPPPEVPHRPPGLDAARWRAFVEDLARRDPPRGNVLREGAFVGMEGGVAVVEFPATKMRYARAYATDPRVLDEAERFLSGRFAFQFREAAAAAASSSPAEEQRQAERDRAEDVLRRVQRHPALDLLRGAFPGLELKETRPLPQDPEAR